jgi:hypothetical protein
MLGQLILPAADSQDPNSATRKAYVDTLIGRAPTNQDVANAIAVLTATGTGTIDLRIAAAVANYLPLAGGTLTGALTLAGAPVNALHAATKGYVDALPVQAPYDAIVDAAGTGDYTSVVTACATEAAGASIYILSGTYNEVADVVMKDGQMLIGQNPEDTVIDFGGGAFNIDGTGAGNNRYIANLTIQLSTANYFIDTAGDNDRCLNCRFIGTVAANSALRMSGDNTVISMNHITGFTKAAVIYGIYTIGGNYSTILGNKIDATRRGIAAGTYASIGHNHMTGITDVQMLLGLQNKVVANTLIGNQEVYVHHQCEIVGNDIRGVISWASDYDFVIVSGNNFLTGGEINCGYATVHDCIFSNNVFNTGNGIVFNGYNSSVNGNTFWGSAHLQWGANAHHNTAVGNNLSGSTEANATRINDLGLEGNTAYNNAGVPITSEKHYTEMRNTSGGALVDGDVVVFNNVASGNEVTTTVNQGDDLVAGVFNAGVANNAWDVMQDRGKITTLKVNGVINIAIGDLLGTFTAAGISMQAQAGDMAFAIALEAYAGADSNGVIDALLISPRKV